MLRPAVALCRLAIDADDTVSVGLRGTWSDGTTALRFDPVDFVGRLAALVPPRRAHLVRYHGVLAPAARWRSRVVPPRPSALHAAPAPLALRQPDDHSVGAIMAVAARDRAVPWLLPNASGGVRPTASAELLRDVDRCLQTIAVSSEDGPGRPVGPSTDARRAGAPHPLAHAAIARSD